LPPVAKIPVCSVTHALSDEFREPRSDNEPELGPVIPIVTDDDEPRLCPCPDTNND
jgi:hypothetical protein